MATRSAATPHYTKAAVALQQRSTNRCYAGAFVHEGKEHVSTTAVEEVQELCHMSLQACQQDGECAPLLEKVMMWCEHSHCEPDRCRGALQNFYDSVSIQRRLEVAFCVCRQNDNDGQCLTAMRKLHPNCAERHTGADPRQCHEIARQCRDNDNCRRKLEAYEKQCASDAFTGQCAGTHRSCQHAVTNILGTELHASCVCKGTDFLHLQDCYSWHKLLWSNPCVVESHLALQTEIKNGASLDEVFTRAPQTTSTPYSTSTSTLLPDIDNKYGRVYMTLDGGYPYPTTGKEIQVIPPFDRDFPHPPQDFEMHKPGVRLRPPAPERGYRQGPPGHAHRSVGGVSPSPALKEDKPALPKGIQLVGNRSRWGTRYPAGGRQPPPSGPSQPGGLRSGGEAGIADRRRHQLPHVNGAPGGADLYPNSASLPSYHHVVGVSGRMDGGDGEGSAGNYSSGDTVDACIIEEEDEAKNVRRIEIPVNGSRRMMLKAGCSDLCLCQKPEGKKVPALSCAHLSCVKQRGCNTTKAVFSHTAPYIQAFRGICICYNGKFICQRPAPDQFKPGPGVYLFLGYSKDEMEILKPFIFMNEIQALREIEKLLKDKYGFKCKLVVKEQIDQNIILMPELEDEAAEVDFGDSKRKRRRDVVTSYHDDCTKPLEELASWINKRPRDNDVHTDAYLSMFILAEVHVNISEAQASQLSIAVKMATAAATAAVTTAVATLPVSVGLYWSWAVAQVEAAAAV